MPVNNNRPRISCTIFFKSCIGLVMLASCHSLFAGFLSHTGFESEAQRVVQHQLSSRDAATANYLTVCDLGTFHQRLRRFARCSVRIYDGHHGKAGEWRAYRGTYLLNCIEGRSCAILNMHRHLVRPAIGQ